MASAKEQLSAYLKAKKMRQTPERTEILDFIYSQSSIVDVEDIYNAMHDRFHVCLPTIYSTLDILQKCNLVTKHTFNSKTVCYSKVVSGIGHYFRICLQCGTYKEFTDLKLDKSVSIRTFSAFTVFHHSLYLYGMCKKCSSKTKKKIIIVR